MNSPAKIRKGELILKPKSSTKKGTNIRAAVVASQYHKPIVEKLVEGSVRGFTQKGVKKDRIEIFWVPGAFEIPLMAKKLAESKKYDCLVCVGCVLKGETDHYEHVARSVSMGIQSASLSTGVPISFSVLLSDDPQIAYERARENENNRGYEGALAAFEMANLLKEMIPKSERHKY